MNQYKIIPYLSKGLLGLFLLALQSCITDYQGTIGGSSEVLVVNGLLTDEYKKQVVQLSRSYTFENAGPRYETDAAVTAVSYTHLTLPTNREV